jgi:hypothetical protein
MLKTKMLIVLITSISTAISVFSIRKKLITMLIMLLKQEIATLLYCICYNFVIERLNIESGETGLNESSCY